MSRSNSDQNFYNYSFNLRSGLSLKLDKGDTPSLGDSTGLQKGLILYKGKHSLCGEGVGFGAIALEYSNQIIFSTRANAVQYGKEIIKKFSMDSLHRKHLKNGFSLENRIFQTIKKKFDEIYKTKNSLRSCLKYLIKIQPLLGIKFSFEKIKSSGIVTVKYRLRKDRLVITVDSSKLLRKGLNRILIFNEQSADFKLYKDSSNLLHFDEIGVWNLVNTNEACLTNENIRVSFCVKNIPGIRLYRGYEKIKPRLNWAGFCYSIPPEKINFKYDIRITELITW
jgi:hypothetical protein